MNFLPKMDCHEKTLFLVDDKMFIVIETALPKSCGANAWEYRMLACMGRYIRMRILILGCN